MAWITAASRDGPYAIFCHDRRPSVHLCYTEVITAPTHVLRGVFLHLREKRFLETHQTRILELLEQPKGWNETDLFAPHASSDSVVPFSRSGFRHAVTTALFQNPDFRSCRLKLGVAMFCSVSLFPVNRM